MKHSFVLGVHPSTRGFGWALFEGPLVPFDWGTVEVQANKNAGSIARFTRLLDKYQPNVLALEAFDTDDTRRSARVRSLCRKLVAIADARAITVRIYNREVIGKTVASNEDATRDEIAVAVAERIAVLHARLPEPRKPWQSEPPSIALFQAAACALTYLLGPCS